MKNQFLPAYRRKLKNCAIRSQIMILVNIWTTFINYLVYKNKTNLVKILSDSHVPFSLYYLFLLVYTMNRIFDIIQTKNFVLLMKDSLCFTYLCRSGMLEELMISGLTQKFLSPPSTNIWRPNGKKRKTRGFCLFDWRTGSAVSPTTICSRQLFTFTY